MEAIVLAGGFGTRLRQVVPDWPKPMAPVAGRPFLEILLASLSRKGFNRIIMSLGFMSEKIIQHFGKQFSGLELTYAIEDKPLGTGGAVRLAMESCIEDYVYVFNGDTFLDLEVHCVEELWQRQRQPIIVGRTVSDTARYGRLIVDNESVLRFSEKGMAGEGLINVGCYVLNARQLDSFALNEPFSLETDYLAKEVRKQRFNLYVTQGYFVDIGIPEDYAKAQSELAGFK